MDASVLVHDCWADNAECASGPIALSTEGDGRSVGASATRRIHLDRRHRPGRAARRARLGELRSAANLLAVCYQTAEPVDEAICLALDASSPIVDALRASSVESLSAFLTTAHEVAPDFAGKAIELLGGREAMLQRIRAVDPWIVELQLDETPEATNAVGRFLHISDTEQDDPDEAAHAISRRLWSLVPGIDGVEVRAVLPGGGPHRIGGYERGVSQLLRESHLSEHATAWNRGACSSDPDVARCQRLASPSGAASAA